MYDYNNTTAVQMKKYKESDNFFSKTTVAVFMAEFLGTAGFVYMACLGGTPLVAGLAIAGMVQMFGHVSGAHVNPSVTVGTVIAGQLSPLMGAVYLCAQFVGSFCGYGLLTVMLEVKTFPFCVTTVNLAIITEAQAVCIELVLTAFLVMTVCSFGDPKNKTNGDSVPIRLGFILVGIFSAGGPLTGASLHPFKSFWPAVFEDFWTLHYVYWVGPLAGAVISGLLYRFIFKSKEEDE